MIFVLFSKFSRTHAGLRSGRGIRQEVLDAKGVTVIVEGAHMCAMMRGVKKSETNMSTRTMLGAFQDDPTLRAELLAQIAMAAPK